jgi:cytochrome oxidase Cu insertion factor (SCO1/SenC/PrrC family)
MRSDTDPCHSKRNRESTPPPIGRRRAGVSTALPFFLSLLVLFGIAYFGWTWYRIARHDVERSQAIDDIGPPLAVTEFELTERSGKPFKSSDMKGRVWVVTYFFTTCPGECIRLNRNIQVMHNLPELNDVVWVSITCDPDTDTVATLRKYADSLSADPDRWLFCVGDLDYTKRVALGMKLFLSRQGHQNYAIVIDKAGKIRGMFDGTSTSDCERMKTKLEELVAETPEEAAAAGKETT